MCRGLGLLANFKEVRFIENNTSHSSIEGTNKLDTYCKIEIIRNDETKRGYNIALDEQIDDKTKEIWQTQKFITADCKINKKLLKKIQEWCKQNEIAIWRSFAKGCSTYAKIKGNNDQYGSTIEGNNYQARSTIKGDNNQSGSTIKGDNNQSESTIEGESYIGMQTHTKHDKLTNLIKKASKELHPGETWKLTLAEFAEWLGDSQ